MKIEFRNKKGDLVAKTRELDADFAVKYSKFQDTVKSMLGSGMTQYTKNELQTIIQEFLKLCIKEGFLQEELVPMVEFEFNTVNIYFWR